jgi:poly(A) polymerase
MHTQRRRLSKSAPRAAAMRSCRTPRRRLGSNCLGRGSALICHLACRTVATAHRIDRRLALAPGREIAVTTLSAEAQRRFALEVVRRLREAGFAAYWAGGCVRDRLAGRTPKDYDVATDARPEQIREVFGSRRTIAIGAAFGVITVIGPREAGQVEVATFREDAAYSDGRHPDRVTFSTPAIDAARRDFTINGLYYDPVDDRVIDYVGGRDDLAGRLVRAIGDPYQRFNEDKLRLLRAVRFAATFDFALEERTQEAIGRMAPEIVAVSAERIAAEIERILVDRHRCRAVRLLLETGLATAVLPEIVPGSPTQQARIDDSLAVLGHLDGPGFPLALAALLCRWVDPSGANAVCRRWRLSNRHTDRVTWLVGHHGALGAPRAMPWSRLQPLLIADGIADLLALEKATARAAQRDTSHVAWCRLLVSLPREVLDPPRLLSGDDLLQHGVPPGPHYRTLLEQLRDAQLDGEVLTKAAALELAHRRWERMRDEGTAMADQ